jgi:hypothetical protein
MHAIEKMVQEMVKDAQWITRVNDMRIPKIKNLYDLQQICRNYTKVLQELETVLHHDQEHKCRCRSIILQSTHAWIAFNEPMYRDFVKRAVFPCIATIPRPPCWLIENILFYASGVVAFHTPHLRLRYQDVLTLLENGRQKNAAALFWYTLTNVAEKVTTKYPTLHHKDNTCDCRRYFTQAPKNKTLSKIYELEPRINNALKLKNNNNEYNDKCWTAHAIHKYRRYIRVYSQLH